MDQSVALNALAPYVALAKSATAPRAAADLISQATSAANTYVFAELLAQPNVQQLSGQEQYGGHYELLKCFAWGTWEQYKATAGLPELSDSQTLKLRLLSLLTIASEPKSTTSNLSYTTLCTRLGLSSSIDLEHLITQAIYSNLLTGTLNPAGQTVVITSVSPLRDLAPGSIATMMDALAAWSSRCDVVLGDLQAEIQKVRTDAVKRAKEEARVDRQVQAVTEAAEKSGGGGGGGYGGLGGNRPLRETRGMGKKDQDEFESDEDGMDIDGGVGIAAGKKKGGGGALGGFMGRFGGGGGRTGR